MKKKGQAAMEFLMTYGWAILAAVIVVGVLWYIIGDPGNLVGNKFAMSSPLVANAMSVSTTGFILEFRNGAGEQITVSQIQITGGCHTAGAVAAVTDPSPLANGALGNLTTACTATLGSDTKLNGDVTIYYTKGAGNIIQQATGSINAQVP